jgi:hypothetical protein
MFSLREFLFGPRLPLTVLDVINLELVRLHEELAEMSWSNGEPGAGYRLMTAEVAKLNDHLIKLSSP